MDSRLYFLTLLGLLLLFVGMVAITELIKRRMDLNLYLWIQVGMVGLICLSYPIFWHYNPNVILGIACPFVLFALFYGAKKTFTCLFLGKIIFHEKIKVQLPEFRSVFFEPLKDKSLVVMVYLKNSHFRAVHGSLKLLSDKNDLLAEKVLTEPKGYLVKNYRGEWQRTQSSGKGYQTTSLAFLQVTKNSSAKVCLELNLNWNFTGWNSAWEWRLPKDRFLDFEILVRAN